VLCDEARLLIFVACVDGDGWLSFRYAREEAFRVALFDIRDDGVGYVQNRLSTAKVLFQLDDLRGGKEFRELKHVPVARATKRIDRLALVADDSHVVMRRRQQPHDLRL
jgi:hypothetical protein